LGSRHHRDEQQGEDGDVNAVEVGDAELEMDGDAEDGDANDVDPGDYLSPASHTHSKARKLQTCYYDERDANEDSEEEYSTRSEDGNDDNDEEDSEAGGV
jgi:hypothetical protein